MNIVRHQARLAGLLYLAVGIFGGFSLGYFQPLLLVAGNPAETGASFTRQLGLLPWVVLADLIQVVAFFFLALQLGKILRPFGDGLVRAFILLVALAGALMALNNALLLAARELMAQPEQVYGLLTVHHWVTLMAQVFFGLWLIPLGLVAWKSGLFPRWLSGLLVAGGAGYLLNLAVLIVAPAGYQSWAGWLVAPAAAAEIAMVLYLLIWGVKSKKRGEPALASLK